MFHAVFCYIGFKLGTLNLPTLLPAIDPNKSLLGSQKQKKHLNFDLIITSCHSAPLPPASISQTDNNV